MDSTYSSTKEMKSSLSAVETNAIIPSADLFCTKPVKKNEPFCISLFVFPKAIRYKYFFLSDTNLSLRLLQIV